MREFCLQARAKVNLTMDVKYRRADGYHEVDLLMQSVSLCDTLALKEHETLSLTIDGNLAVEEDNLVLRAARMLAEDAGIAPRACLHLQKRIPVAAGMGGGSADAAAALAGLNKLWRLDYPLERLMEIGARLGADVPFCMVGGCRRATGVGTQLEDVASALELNLVVVKPCAGLLTREVFGALRLDAATRHPDTPGAVRAAQAGDLGALVECMGNVLEPVAMARRPEIAVAIGDVLAQGAQGARMSGSGPTVFGLFDSWEKAVEAAVALKRKYAECCAARNVAAGLKFMEE